MVPDRDVVHLEIRSRQAAENESGGLVMAHLPEPWNNTCPCGHDWEDHSLELGCTAGWAYDGPDPGVASTDGCMCPLAHTERSSTRG